MPNIKKTKLKKKDTNHGPFDKIMVRLDVPGETLLAVHNALSWTLAHSNEYTSEVDDCKTCLEAMEAFQNYLMHVANNALAYNVKGKPN